MRRYGLFGLVLGLFLTACAANLPPVAVEQGVIFGSPSREQVAQTMAQAATRAKWQVRSRSADALDIFFTHKGYVYAAKISFTTQTYRIDFVSSEGSVHDADEVIVYYNKQVRRLNTYINRFLSKAFY